MELEYERSLASYLNASPQWVVLHEKAAEPIGDTCRLSAAGHYKWAFECCNLVPCSCSLVPSAVMMGMVSALISCCTRCDGARASH